MACNWRVRSQIDSVESRKADIDSERCTYNVVGLKEALRS